MPVDHKKKICTVLTSWRFLKSKKCIADCTWNIVPRLETVTYSFGLKIVPADTYCTVYSFLSAIFFWKQKNMPDRGPAYFVGLSGFFGGSSGMFCDFTPILRL